MKAWATFMRLLYSATFTSYSISSPRASWRSFGGMKTCSMTKGKIESGPWAVEVGITMDDETVDITINGEKRQSSDGWTTVTWRCPFTFRKEDGLVITSKFVN